MLAYGSHTDFALGPKILYKYRQWNDFTKEIISDQEIYCPSPPQLNDPFDCKAGLYYQNIELDEFLMNVHISSFTFFYLLPTSNLLEESKKKEIRKYLQAHRGKTKTLFNYTQRFLLEQNPQAATLSTGKDYIKKFEIQANGLGVFSLTEDPLNMLMWSHYGDQHQGIAIGFEQINKNDLGDTSKCRQVIYDDKFPIANFENIEQQLSYSIDPNFSINKTIDFNIDTPFIKTTFFYKASCWSYEKEWRLLEVSSGKRSLPGKIAHIIFGCKCPEYIINEVKQLVKLHISNHVQFYKVNIKYNSFSLFLMRI